MTEQLRSLTFRWTRATWVGWLLGIPLIAAFALLGEMVGIGGAQVLVGAGMGTSIGFFQSRVIRREFELRSAWFWSSAIGLSLPFLATDLGKFAGWTSAYSVYVCVALGGIIMGAWQTMLLRRHCQKSHWWLVASALGWSLAGAASGVADPMVGGPQLRGIWGALLYLALISGGGLLLGLVTGSALARLPRRAAAIESAS